MKKNVLLLTTILTVFVGIIQPTEAEGIIVVDGNISDWIALGLTPLRIDQPYNIESYHDTCADLLEAWVYHNSNNLYLMIKVRGGYPDNWDNTGYIICLDIDQNPNTGSGKGEGHEYYISGLNGYGGLHVWNEITLEFDLEKLIPVAAGDLGYVEWCVPLEDIQHPEKVDLQVHSFDNTLNERVNVIYLYDVVIPEFQSAIILLLTITLSTLVIIFAKKKLFVKTCLSTLG